MRTLFYLGLILTGPVMAANSDEITYKISCETSSSFPPVQGNLLTFDAKEPEKIRTASGDWNTNGKGWFEQAFDAKVTALEVPRKGIVALLLFELTATKSTAQNGANADDAPQSLHFLFSRENGKGTGMVRLRGDTQMSVTCDRW